MEIKRTGSEIDRPEAIHFEPDLNEMVSRFEVKW